MKYFFTCFDVSRDALHLAALFELKDLMEQVKFSGMGAQKFDADLKLFLSGSCPPAGKMSVLKQVECLCFPERGVSFCNRFGPVCPEVRFGIPKGSITMPPVNIMGFARRLGINGIFDSMPAIRADVYLALWSLACTVTFDEQGTKDAAAALGLGVAKGVGGSRPIFFTLDRPFVFCIFSDRCLAKIVKLFRLRIHNGTLHF